MEIKYWLILNSTNGNSFVPTHVIDKNDIRVSTRICKIKIDTTYLLGERIRYIFKSRFVPVKNDNVLKILSTIPNVK